MTIIYYYELIIYNIEVQQIRYNYHLLVKKTAGLLHTEAFVIMLT